MKIVLCGNFKGGCGKSFHNVILSKQLAERGYKILFLDFDSQMNGTTFLSGRSKSDDEFNSKNIYHAIVNENLMNNIVILNQNIDYVPSSRWIHQFSQLMNQKNERDRHLFFRKLLAPLVKERKYDFCFLDMSPTNSSLNISVMSTATHHIVITQSEYFSMQMVPDYVQHIKMLKKNYNVSTDVLGISVSLLDARSTLEKKVVSTIKDKYPSLVFNTVIRRKAALKGYAASGYPEKKLKKDKVALAEYERMADEILDRLQMPKVLGGISGE
jgi:chromosome partitioning protein